jgi:hypothetical protein
MGKSLPSPYIKGFRTCLKREDVHSATQMVQKFLQVENLIFNTTSFVSGVFVQLRGNNLFVGQRISELRKKASVE